MDRPGLLAKPPPATVGHLPFPSVIQVPGDALQVSGEAKSGIVKHRGLWDQTDLGTDPGSLLISCVTLGQLLTLSVPQFPDMVVMTVPTSQSYFED